MERRSHFELLKYTPYLGLLQELLGVYCEFIWEYWPYAGYNGTTLY